MIESFELDDSTREFIRACIRRKNFDWTEQFFLDVINEPRNKMEVYWAVLALRGYGTERCIPLLKQLLYFPKQDVKACSILTIAQIAQATESAFYAAALVDPKYSEKGYALWAIFAAADESAVDAVTNYLTTNLSKIRRNKLSIDTYGMGVEYLLKHLGSAPASNELLKKIVACKVPTSPAEEKLFMHVKANLMKLSK